MGIDPTLQATTIDLDPVSLPACNFEARAFGGGPENSPVCRWCRPNVYAGTLHYLKAVDKAGSPTDGKAVVAGMKATPTEDALFGKGTIREDGRHMHPMYLLQVKTPAESKSEWDVFKITAIIPAERAFRPLKDGVCPLVKQ